MRRDESYPVGAHARLEVGIPAGVIHVNAGESGAISLAIGASDTDAFDVSHLGDTVTVRQVSRHGRSVHVVARVPAGADVTVIGVATQIELRGQLGATRVRTTSGDIDVEHVERLELVTASGDARVGATTGDASVSSASGDITIGAVAGRLTGSLASGDVRVDRVGGGFDVRTASGDVVVGRCDGDDIAIKTVSGDISLGLPSGIRVEPEISTLSGRTTLPEPAPSEPAAPRRHVRLRLTTVSGDIRVDRVH